MAPALMRRCYRSIPNGVMTAHDLVVCSVKLLVRKWPVIKGEWEGRLCLMIVAQIERLLASSGSFSFPLDFFRLTPQRLIVPSRFLYPTTRLHALRIIPHYARAISSAKKCATRSVYHFTTPEELWQSYGSGDSYHTRTIWRKPSSNLPRTIARWVWLKPRGVRGGTWIGSGERDCSYTEQWYKREAFHGRQLSQRRVSTKPRRKRWAKH